MAVSQTTELHYTDNKTGLGMDNKTGINRTNSESRDTSSDVAVTYTSSSICLLSKQYYDLRCCTVHKALFLGIK